MKIDKDKISIDQLPKNLSTFFENWNNIAVIDQKRILEKISSLITNLDYPFFENDSRAILVYKEEAREVKLLSDITGWIDPIPFKQLPDTDLFYLNVDLEPDARIQYLLVVDGVPLTDPLNRFIVKHGLGEMSELAMPRYFKHPYFEEFLSGNEGSYDGLHINILGAGVLPYEHEIFVYLPPDYQANKKYPSIYFHDGPDYIKFGLAAYSIDRLILENIIEPCIAVFVTPPNLHQPKEPNRSTEYGMNDDYVNFFCEELVPFIDKNYLTINNPNKRLIIGDSYAGLISLYIAFTRNDLFANIYSQSGYLSFNNEKIIKLFSEQDTKPVKIFLDIGTYEKKVGADFLPASELDFITANRKMKEVLHEKKYDFLYKEYNEGHTWGNWRRHLIDALIYFLRIEGELK